MSKSKDFGPGAYDELKGSTVHFTCDFEKPSCFAIAYATPLSYPLPFDGVLFSNHGG